MELDYSITQKPDYLYVKVKGEYSLTAFQSLADRIYAEALEKNARDVLVDALELTGKTPGMDRYALGEYVAKVWKQTIRAAIVYPARDIDKFFENVAVNRAVQITVVGDVDSAMRWLKGMPAGEGR